MRHSDPFLRLRKSAFRRNIHLEPWEKDKVVDQGLSSYAEWAYEVVKDRLNDPDEGGKQTPKQGVVFKAMHATACSCRKCLYKWHKIPRFREMTEGEAIFVVSMVMRWIKKETNDKDSLYNF